MKLEGKRIGFVMTGAFGTFKRTIEQLRKIVEERAEVIPIMSFNAYNLDTKFGKAKNFIDEIRRITRKGNYTYNSRCRANRCKAYDRYNDNCTCNWKYHCKTS